MLDYLYFSVQYCLLGGPEKKKEKKKEIPPRTPDELDSEHEGKMIIYNTFYKDFFQVFTQDQSDSEHKGKKITYNTVKKI